ncbi:ABC transporter ATP-binding protein [Paenibacillus sp. IHBB 10380]|uniref:ABC transporter ATP-binding protein n=1 Tax=Paenibacillus sp. IHBB 10380 TaxID=1566358 RepID=UPI0005CFA69C|nr:ABC transporter ATP-binding protein [Paenibacillus sp. IHBB 10380]AJS57271.1 ATP-binding protein [Paenibacillus sp. IHBB 10380]
MFKMAVFLKPYKKEVIIGPFFKLLEAIFELLLPTIVALIINNGIGMRDTSYVFKMGGLMLFLSILGFGCSMICQYYAARASQGFGTTLRNKIFSHVSSLSYAEMDKYGTPSLINRITNDVNHLQVAVAMLIRLVIRAPFICIGAIIMSMILDFQLSLILLAATPIFGIILYFIITRTSPLYRSYQKKLDKMALLLSENFSGVRVIRAFAKRRQEKQRFNESSEDLTGMAIHVGRISALLNPMTTLVVNAAIIAILWVGGIHINDGRLSQGEIIAFINYITQILLALIVVSNLVIVFTKASSSAARINEVLATTTSISDTGNAVIPMIETLGSVPAIQFNNVSFGYNVTGEVALADISVEIYRGETVGVIGSTGSGKSTFVNLIPRFYDATEGHILIAGVNVRDYSLSQLRKKIGIVPQRALLFTGTIADNIRWGNEYATDEDILQAATIAQADEFITKLPEGIHTLVSRGGRNLSGGQKQRLTIARAVAAKSEILILDDSSSALDFATDAALRRALKENRGEMTVIMVSQRVSTVQQADKIIVFEEGRIAGIGTHDELMESSEVYKEVYLSQLSSEESGK